MSTKIISSISSLLMLLMSHRASSTCHFPKEIYQVQSGWRFMSPDYDTVNENPHSWRKIRAEGERIHVQPMKEDGEPAGSDTLTYHCMADAGVRTYIVMWQKEKSAVFACLGFEVHSPYVVQWMMSTPNRRKPTKCEGSDMSLVDSPMVYYEELESLSIGSTEKVDCPLRGGYVVKDWVDQDGTSGCKENTLPPLKLENACEKGEGLYFLGGSSDCPSPHPKIPTDVPFNCLASWNKGRYTFMLINPMPPNGLLPCLRYPTTRGKSYKLEIFLDGLCDSTDNLAESKSYRQMSLMIYPAEGICSDDTQACEGETSQCQAGVAKTCRKSCEACPEKPGWINEHFPSQYHGTWLKDSNRLREEKVIINNEYIIIPSLGTYRNMGETVCSRKQPSQAPYGLTKSAKEYTLIQTFSNGCSHRATILQIVERGESVLSFRVSKSTIVNWKLRLNEEKFKWQIMDGWTKWCSSVTYILPGEDPQNPFRTDLTGWFNLVKEGASASITNCTIPEHLLEGFHVDIPSKSLQCSGDLKLHNGTLTMIYKDCTGAVKPDVVKVSKFECLAAFNDDNERTYLVTRSQKNSPNVIDQTYICWVFSVGRNLGRVSWFRVSDCDANSEAYAARGHRKSLASFQFQHEGPSDEPYQVSLGSHDVYSPLMLLNTALIGLVIHQLFTLRDLL